MLKLVFWPKLRGERVPRDVCRSPQALEACTQWVTQDSPVLKHLWCNGGRIVKLDIRESMYHVTAPYAGCFVTGLTVDACSETLWRSCENDYIVKAQCRWRTDAVMCVDRNFLALWSRELENGSVCLLESACVINWSVVLLCTSLVLDVVEDSGFTLRVVFLIEVSLNTRSEEKPECDFHMSNTRIRYNTLYMMVCVLKRRQTGKFTVNCEHSVAGFEFHILKTRTKVCAFHCFGS
jgi:hypothetical protein